jgi:hypothetical protein
MLGDCLAVFAGKLGFAESYFGASGALRTEAGGAMWPSRVIPRSCLAMMKYAAPAPTTITSANKDSADPVMNLRINSTPLTFLIIGIWQLGALGKRKAMPFTDLRQAPHFIIGSQAASSYRDST